MPVCKGQDFLAEDGPDVIVSGRESIITESDVSCEICVVSDQLPVVVPKLASVQLAVSVVAQTRPRVGCGPDLPLPVEKGMESLDDDGLDVIISTVMISLRRDHGLAVARTCPCRWTREWSPSMMTVWTAGGQGNGVPR